ncbi:hypothetical protein KCV03_g27, partial [Aureobasidium melanogenum]
MRATLIRQADMKTQSSLWLLHMRTGSNDALTDSSLPSDTRKHRFRLLYALSRKRANGEGNIPGGKCGEDEESTTGAK